MTEATTEQTEPKQPEETLETVQACKACGCLVPSDLFVRHVEFHNKIDGKVASPKLHLPK